MIKISVIIPVYNSVPYIIKCLDSIIYQTLSGIEIICVNDGSQDNSLEILNEYAKKDSRIIVINQENKKQGAARNAGLKIARGEYVGFVDSDDWIDSDFYEKLYDCAKKYNSDIALATNVRIGNGKTKKRINITSENFYTKLQDKFDVCKLWKDGCPTNKIYRRELLINHDIKYPENVYCEDKIFTTKAVFFANGIVTVPDIYYYYYRNQTSTVVKSKFKKGHSDDKNKAKLEVLEFLKANNAKIRDKDFWANTKVIKYFGLNWLTVKESLHTKKLLLFGLIRIKESRI